MIIPQILFFLLAITFPSPGQGAKVHYNLTVSEATTAPDGVTRLSTLWFNSQYPGPLITAKSGDILHVHVHNNLSDPTSVHWHGFFQNGTQFQDGPAMITQCPIQAGQSQEYRFPVSQTGTYWYHAHYDSQYTDGLIGPLIIRDPTDPDTYGYTPHAEMVIILTDWYTWSYKINQMFHNKTGIPPFPHSALINGRGTFPCLLVQPQDTLASVGLELPDFIQTRGCDTRKQSRSLFLIKPGTVVRIRVINASAMSAFTFSIDFHKLVPIEADGVAVKKGEPVDLAYIGAAQRYSFLVSMNQRPTTYNIRAVIDTEFLTVFDTVPNLNLNAEWTLQPQVTAGLVYSKGRKDPRPEESWEHYTYTQANRVEDNGRVGEVGLDDMTLRPRDGKKAPEKVDLEFKLDIGLVPTPVPYSLFNGKAAKFPEDWEEPWLMTLAKGGELKNSSNPMYIGHNQVAQFVINNYEPFAHPLHLHGNDFWVVGKGKKFSGPYVPQVHASSLNTSAVRRDTAVILAESWMVIRLIGDNPGVWMFHCHLDWHNVGGMAMTVVVAKDKLDGMKVPAETKRVCRQRDLNGEKN